MSEEKIKASFEKIKKDIEFLTEQLASLRTEVSEIKANFTGKSSIGNEGVPTDRQTDTPTSNRYSALVDDEFSPVFETPTHNPTQNPTHTQHTNTKTQQTNTSFDGINSMTELVNTLKNDLKTRFRSLTKQEFNIFSILFTVDKTQKSATYKDLADKTGLSESSIRDHIQRIIKKGIPIDKERINNKIIILKIPEEIRNLATLDNLLRLRNQIPDKDLNSFSQ